MKKAFYLLTPIILGAIVGFIMKDFIDYNDLIKPPLAPPSIFFPIAWTIIYILMGISFYLYKEKHNNEGDGLYYAQLFVNLLWSIIFFIFKLRLLACFWIVLLDVLVILLLKRFKRIDLSLFLLNLFYVIWILFATYLTIGIYILN